MKNKLLNKTEWNGIERRNDPEARLNWEIAYNDLKDIIPNYSENDQFTVIVNYLKTYKYELSDGAKGRILVELKNNGYMVK